MKPVELAAGVFHLQSGTNIGLAVQDGQGLLIDAGLDKDAARRAQRVADELGVPLTAVFLTHAHADHFGGAGFLQRRAPVRTYAPGLEAAMMEHPIIEPLYLFGGAAPIEELRSRFTLAEPCRVDCVVAAPGRLEIGPFTVDVLALPGHAPNQMGLAIGGVLFCADALFPDETLEKHKVTFCVDMDATLATLARLPELNYDYFAPGHGPAYRAGTEIVTACAANAARLGEIRELVYEGAAEARDTETLLRYVADHYGLHLTTATSFFLARATVLAALSSLEKAGAVALVVENNRLLWQAR
ncbi:MAG: MBL fold metallo-hydrolase [Anaerolineae bacterium]|nr:MBL fold metallo-hydrolase [Anaerolineae bacterium]